jgi:acyl carrier protein
VTRDEIREVVVRVLDRIAPEAAGAPLRPDVPFRDQLDLDSMDTLNFAIGLHEQLGVDVPERDYGKLTTLDATVGYLEGRLK